VKEDSTISARRGIGGAGSSSSSSREGRLKDIRSAWNWGCRTWQHSFYLLPLSEIS
jgi:hypothetical protein